MVDKMILITKLSLMKKLMITAVFLALALASGIKAQSQSKSDSTAFKPGWYITANGGVSWILAEGNNFLRSSVNDYFSLLNNGGLSARLGAGYDFTPVYGVRSYLGYTATNWPDWRNNFDFKSFDAYYLNADFVMNLSNLIKGYNPKRFVDFAAFAGLGGDLRNQGDLTSNWLNLVGRIGAQADFKLSKQLALNLIGDVTLAGDKYNDYSGGTPVDLLPALSLGLTYRFGNSFGFMGQVQATKQLKIGYAFDLTTTEIGVYSKGTHEILVNFDFSFGRGRVRSPRYF